MVEKIEEPAPEQFLYRLWSDERILHRRLQTLDGRPVVIVYRGRRNQDSGPDYLDAHVSIGGHLFRGDIEIDPIASDWYSHGHHKNSLYNNVVLHIVTMYCPASAQTIRSDGISAPILNLDQFLEIPAEQMAEIQQDTIEEKRALFAACAMSEKDELTILNRLEFYGLERFRIKVARFVEERQVSSWEQCFYCALLEALGYAKNQIPFRRLARLLPIEVLREQIRLGAVDSPVILAEAYLFGAAGLLPSQNPKSCVAPDGKSSAYIRHLENIWANWDYRRKIDPLPSEAWQFFRLRPQNFPTRRITAAARIAVQFMELGFLDGFARILTGDGRKLTRLVREIERPLQVADDQGFWSKHYSFDEANLEPSQKMEISLLGSERARNIVINVLAPMLHAYADETENYRLKNLTLSLYSQYPRETENIITRWLRQRIYGDEKGGIKRANRAIHQQGLIHLAKNLCLEEDCDRCWRKQTL